MEPDPLSGTHGPSPVLATWCPPAGPQPVIVRWLVTEWCNYACPYCPQTHDRFAPKGEYTAHAFDNHPLARWLEGFDRHFSAHRLSLVITGGEPMLDVRNMPPLLRHLHRQEYVACIRIDTNASWAPEKYADVDKDKLILMCTFHPSQVTEADFLDKLERLRASGFRIGMVNYVMDRANVALFQRRHREFFDRGFLLHPNPLWGGNGKHTADDLELMRAYLPDLDFQHRSESTSPYGHPCLFPSLGYEMRYTGLIRPGCSAESSDFFADALPPRPVGWTACPHRRCACLDKYSFRQGVERNTSLNPLGDYALALAAIAAKRDSRAAGTAA